MDIQKTKSFLFRRRIVIALAILILLSISINLWWIIADNYPPRGDGLEIVNEALNLYYKDTGQDYQIVIPYYTGPPFFPSIVSYYYRIFGVYSKNELVLNAVFLCVLLIGAYKLGEHIYNKKAGLLSAIITASLFGVLIGSKSNFREFHLLCLLPLTFYFMLRTEYFRDLHYSLLYGMMLGICGLIDYYVGFMFLPVSLIHIIFGTRKLQEKKSKKSKILKNIAVTFGVAFIIGGLWYVLNIEYLWQTFMSRSSIIEHGHSPFSLFSFQRVMINLFLIINNDTGFIYGGLFLISMAWLFTKRKKTESELLLICSFALPYLIWIFIPYYSEQVVRPLLYTIPIIISGFIDKIRASPGKQLLKLTIIIYALGIIFSQATGVSFINPRFRDGQLCLDRFSLINRALGLPQDNPSIIERVFMETQENTVYNTTYLLVSNDHVHFWDLLYMRNINKQGYRVFAYFRGPGFEKWGYDDNVVNGFIYNFNITEMIHSEEFDYIFVFVPKEYPEKGVQDNNFRPSLEIIELEEFEKNYWQSSIIHGNNDSEEFFTNLLVYKRKTY
ncbi:glycosyltransferase family 39 protein [Candidatus Woesearchaeota archaeon]|nr:glycosyltransferase family 39 protein [Candidatus Woesearchaeota archaeon]